MANRAYLLNTSFLTSDPYLLEERLNEPANDYVEVGEAAYKIPVPWLLCFRPEDVQTVIIPPEEGDEDDEVVEIGLPCTSVKRALERMEGSLSVFESIAGDAGLGKMFWQAAMAHLQGLPLPYLTMNPLEVIFGNDPEEYVESMMAAIGGGDAAIEHLMGLSFYEEGVLPYPLDVLYAVPGNDDGDEVRLQNCVALDIGNGGSWHESVGSDDAKHPDIPFHLDAPMLVPNLQSVLAEAEALAKAQVESACVHLSFAPRVAGQCEQLKMLLSADTDEECSVLMAHGAFKSALDGVIVARFDEICGNHGFGWAGYVVRSDQSVKARFKGDYAVYNDWVSLPGMGCSRRA